MSFADELIAARDSAASILHQFLLNSRRPAGADVHTFYENASDEPFYARMIHLTSSQPTHYHSYHCGNKKSVYDAHCKISRRNPRGQVTLFFVDKDLDDLIPVHWPSAHNIFVTDTYSIENYMVSAEVLEHVWQSHLRQPRGAREFSIVLARFHAAHETFICECQVLMCWLLHQRRAGATCPFGNIRLDQLFEFTPDLRIKSNIDKTNPASQFEEMTHVATASDWDAKLPILMSSIRAHSYKSIIRGKFEFWFFIQFIRALTLEVQKARQPGSPRINFQISESSAISLLSSGASCPPGLSGFLSQFL